VNGLRFHLAASPVKSVDRARRNMLSGWTMTHWSRGADERRSPIAPAGEMWSVRVVCPSFFTRWEIPEVLSIPPREGLQAAAVARCSARCDLPRSCRPGRARALQKSRVAAPRRPLGRAVLAPGRLKRNGLCVGPGIVPGGRWANAFELDDVTPKAIAVSDLGGARVRETRQGSPS